MTIENAENPNGESGTPNGEEEIVNESVSLTPEQIKAEMERLAATTSGSQSGPRGNKHVPKHLVCHILVFRDILQHQTHKQSLNSYVRELAITISGSVSPMFNKKAAGDIQMDQKEITPSMQPLALLIAE